MRKIFGVVCVLGMLTAATFAAPDDHSSVVIVFKDGHQQSIPMADIASIQFKTSTTTVAALPTQIPSKNHFVGKWQVGEGNGNDFFITLEADGDARKSLGEKHGTWVLVDGEARISWEDGWHDVIRKVGTKHEKVAFEPGKSFSDEPSNITGARNTQPKPL